jgi:hypothetical protein
VRAGRPIPYRMRRLLLPPLLLLAAAVPAAAAGHPGFVRGYVGTVSALTSTAITVKPVSGKAPVTCALGSRSPSVAAVKVGSRVQMLCVLADGKPTLAKLRLLPPTPPPAVSGVVTAVSETSLTVEGPAHRTMTCSVGEESPSVEGLEVGDRVVVLCDRDRVLRKLVKPLGGDGPGPTSGLVFRGELTDVTDTSVTVEGPAGRSVTCSIGDVSPGLDGFEVGDEVVVLCDGDHVLRKIGKPFGAGGPGPGRGGPHPGPKPHTK